jgi:hypothetical protein
MSNDYVSRVRKGVQVLDEIAPGWEFRIPKSRLSVSANPVQMILLRLYKVRGAVLPLLRSRFPSHYSNNRILRELGLRASKDSATDDFNFKEERGLSAEWVRVVEKRTS